MADKIPVTYYSNGERKVIGRVVSYNEQTKIFTFQLNDEKEYLLLQDVVSELIVYISPAIPFNFGKENNGEIVE